MLDLNVIRQRAATRANVDKPASAANRLKPAEPASPVIGQLARVAALAGDARPVRSCATCRHLSRVKTCMRPVEAGLSKQFGIRWPAPEHGQQCQAWRRDPYEAQTRVLIEAARRSWSATALDAWLADADADPEAVLDVLGRTVAVVDL